MKILSLILISFFSLQVFAAEKLTATGEVFDKDGKEKMFIYEKYQSVEGNKVTDRAVYKDLSGEVLVEEKQVTENGKLSLYDIEQKQLKQHGWIEVKGDKVIFNLKKFRKNNFPQENNAPEVYASSLGIVPLIEANWDALLGGKEVEFKLAVWDRQEFITFDLKKESVDDKTFVVKMSPSSMIIRAIVDPIYFNFDKSNKHLLSYKGRTKPKVKKGNNWHDFDGLTTYKIMK